LSLLANYVTLVTHFLFLSLIIMYRILNWEADWDKPWKGRTLYVGWVEASCNLHY